MVPLTHDTPHYLAGLLGKHREVDVHMIGTCLDVDISHLCRSSDILSEDPPERFQCFLDGMGLEGVDRIFGGGVVIFPVARGSLGQGSERGSFH